MNIFLIGYRCTGKTTIGKQLSAQLGLKFIDTDISVEQTAGMNISALIDQIGWQEFRQFETRALERAARNNNAVISTGGGIILSAQNRQRIRSSGVCVWLTADVDTIVSRMENDLKTDASRPRFSRMDLATETRTVLKERIPLYEKTHHIKIDTAKLPLTECVQTICRSIDNVRI